MTFTDRRDAGRRLIDLLPSFTATPTVVALPRGGVPVASEIARGLGAPLDILAVRKLAAPGNPEFGIGAIAEDGTSVLDRHSARAAGVGSARGERRRSWSWFPSRRPMRSRCSPERPTMSEDFSEVTDEDVVSLLEAARQTIPRPQADSPP